jgi:hypothetical protein
MSQLATDARIDTQPVDLRTAAAIEATEIRAWTDLYAAAPRDFADAAGISTRTVDGTLVITWAATGRRYFSRTIGLGVVEPATEAALDDILDAYARAGIEMFLLQSLPHCRPAEYEDWLRARDLEPFDVQDRVVRGGEPLAARRPGSDRDLAVERVTAATADEWVDLLERDYGLDTGRWLHALVGRPGWHHYVAREGGRVIAARGMYLEEPGAVAWLGVDGPVPGLRTKDFEPDAAICARIVADGLAAGARGFIADIEAPSRALDTPAYDYFGRLGFRRPYERTHWTSSSSLDGR